VTTICSDKTGTLTEVGAARGGSGLGAGDEHTEPPLAQGSMVAREMWSHDWRMHFEGPPLLVLAHAAPSGLA
jgi:hypothetical protein